MTNSEQDKMIAFERYVKAAEKGDASAQYHLGMMFADGLGVEKDERKAVEWYSKAAEQGHAAAKLNLRRMYEYGRGVDKSGTKAGERYSKAASQGDAQDRLSELSNFSGDYEDVCVFSKNAISSSVGARHYLVLLKDGSLFAWGDSSHNQTGVPAEGFVDRPTKILTNVIGVAAGRYHSIALLADGTVLAWGDGEEGQTGRFPIESGGCVPRKVCLPGKALKVFASGNSGAALLENREVWVWGRSEGRPRIQSSPLPEKLGENVLDFCLTNSGFAILKQDGEITCRAIVDQHGGLEPVGFAEHKFKNAKEFISVDIYKKALFLLDSSGNLFKIDLSDLKWGSNEGLCDDLGDPEFQNVSDVFAFEYAIFIKNKDGSLMASGDNFRGEINPLDSSLKFYENDRHYTNLQWHKTSASDIAHVASNIGATLLTDKAGRVFAWGDSALRPFLAPDVLAGKPRKLITNCREISHGLSHTLALNGEGQIFAWGGEKKSYAPSQIKFPSPVQPVKIAASVNTSFMLDSEGNLWVWGYLSANLFDIEESYFCHEPQIMLTGVKNFIPRCPNYISDKAGQMYIEFENIAQLIGKGFTREEGHGYRKEGAFEVPIGADKFYEKGYGEFYLEYKDNTKRLSIERKLGETSWEKSWIETTDDSSSGAADYDRYPAWKKLLNETSVASSPDAGIGDFGGWTLALKGEDIVLYPPVSDFSKDLFKKIKNDALVSLMKQNAEIVGARVLDSIYLGLYERNIGRYLIVIRDEDDNGKQSYYHAELSASLRGDDVTFEFRPVLTGVMPSEIKDICFYDDIYGVDRALLRTEDTLWGFFLDTPYSVYPYAQPDRSWESENEYGDKIAAGTCSTQGVKFKSIRLSLQKTLALADDGTLWVFGREFNGLRANTSTEEILRPAPVLWGIKKILVPFAEMPYELILFNDGSLYEFSLSLLPWFGVRSRKFPFDIAVKDICSGYKAEGEGESYYALLENGEVYTWLRDGGEVFARSVTKEMERHEFYENRLKREDKNRGLGMDSYMEQLNKEKILAQKSKPYEVLFLEGVDSFSANKGDICFLSPEKKEIYRMTNTYSDISCPDPKSSQYYELDTDGNVYKLGDLECDSRDVAEAGTSEKALIMENVAKITSNGEDTIVLTKDGKLFSWGKNQHGCLGTGDKEERWAPQAIR